MYSNNILNFQESTTILNACKKTKVWTKVIDTLTQEDFYGAFQKLLKRYDCIAAGGDYFEGD